MPVSSSDCTRSGLKSLRTDVEGARSLTEVAFAFRRRPQISAEAGGPGDRDGRLDRHRASPRGTRRSRCRHRPGRSWRRRRRRSPRSAGCVRRFPMCRCGQWVSAGLNSERSSPDLAGRQIACRGAARGELRHRSDNGDPSPTATTAAAAEDDDRVRGRGIPVPGASCR